MRKEKWKAYAFFIILSEAVGLLSGFLSRNGMNEFGDITQSSLTPPDVVFPVVWTILYALMGVGAARIWLSEHSKARTESLIVYAAQLAVNFLWSIIFFNFQFFWFALIWLIFLWVLIALMILLYRMVDRPAAWMQFPYFIWVSFAGYLNYAVWMLN